MRRTSTKVKQQSFELVTALYAGKPLVAQNLQALVDVLVHEAFRDIGRGGGHGAGQHQRRDKHRQKGAALEGRRKRHLKSFLVGRMFAVCYGKFKAPGALKLSQKSGKS